MSISINLRRLRPVDALTTLIFINVAVFLVVWIVGLASKLNGGHVDRLVDWLAYPSAFALWLHRPWTLLTYMFTHYGIWHILFNMLMLYCFGRLMLYRCVGSQLASMYVVGGVAGALAYSLAALLWPQLGGTLVGASAAVMAVVGATAAMMPDFRVELFLFGGVKLWVIALVAFCIFAFGLSGSNPGGHISHIGGMLAGIAFGYRINRGHDLTRPLRNATSAIVGLVLSVGTKLRGAIGSRPKRLKKRPIVPGTQRPVPDDATGLHAELDALLDKVRLSGYASLTPDERRRLIEISNKLKQH